MAAFGQGTTQDVRFALRGMRRSPGFVLTAVLTLALGIGATATIFTLVYQVILRSLPVWHPEQLYKLGKDISCCSTGGVQSPDWTLYSYDLYKTLNEQVQDTSGMAAVSAREYATSVREAANGGSSQTLLMEYASGNYFPLLGLHAFRGRLLLPSDDHAGAAPVAVLSYSLWQSRFSGDNHIVGRTLMFGGHPATVVGITDPRFRSERNENNPAGIWVPLAQELTFDPDQKLLQQPGLSWLDVLVRIPDARNVAAVRSQVQRGIKQWVAAHPDVARGATAGDIARIDPDVVSARGGINNLREDYEHSLNLLFLLAAFVLLIACANLANLLLVRGMARQAELAVRSAMGASRGRLIRQALIESIVLALAGGVLALFVAYGGAHAILALAFPGATAGTLSAAPSWPVLGFALAASVLTGLLFGTAPALLASRLMPVQVLRGANRTTGDATALPQRVLVIVQAALSLALLSTAGLLITGLRSLQHQDFHIDPHGRLVLNVDMAAAGYTADRLPAAYTQLDQRLAQIPEVTHSAYSTYAPMTNSYWSTGVYLPGQATPRTATYLQVSPDYFQTLGMQVLVGRPFTTGDTATSGQVAIINKAFADKFFPHQSPVGLHFGPGEGALHDAYEIVGVVDNANYGDGGANKGEAEQGPAFYRPMSQWTHFPKPQSVAVENLVHFPEAIVVQYHGDSATAASAVRNALHSINPDIAILNTQTYDEQLTSDFSQQELVVRLTSIFGLVALALASIGLYGTTAYSVARRTSEIGVRMALGASRGDVLQLVLRSALTQTLIGLALGLPLSLVAGRLVQHSFYQAGSSQPVILLAVTAMLFLAASAAAFLPARRAATLDPMRALRTE